MCKYPEKTRRRVNELSTQEHVSSQASDLFAQVESGDDDELAGFEQQAAADDVSEKAHVSGGWTFNFRDEDEQSGGPSRQRKPVFNSSDRTLSASGAGTTMAKRRNDVNSSTSARPSKVVKKAAPVRQVPLTICKYSVMCVTFIY